MSNNGPDSQVGAFMNSSHNKDNDCNRWHNASSCSSKHDIVHIASMHVANYIMLKVTSRFRYNKFIH